MSWKWAKDKSLGYLKCEVASQVLRAVAISNTKILQFAQKKGPRDGTKPKKGKSESKALVITEMGRGLELPYDYPLFRRYDPEDYIQRRLVDQMARSFEYFSARALKQNALSVTTSSTALKRLIPRAKWNDTEAICGVASGYMSSCVQPYDKNYYMGIGGVRFLRSIKSNRSFLPWKGYLSQGDVLFNGEIGSTNNNIRWVECNDTSLFLDDGVVFGDRGLLIQEVSPIELRIYESMIAWYGILAIGGGDNVLYIPKGKRRRHEKV